MLGLSPSIAKAHRFLEALPTELQVLTVPPGSLQPSIFSSSAATPNSTSYTPSTFAWGTAAGSSWQCRMTRLIHPTLSYPGQPSKVPLADEALLLCHALHTHPRDVFFLSAWLLIGGRWHRLAAGSSRRQRTGGMWCRTSKRAEIGRR